MDHTHSNIPNSREIRSLKHYGLVKILERNKTGRMNILMNYAHTNNEHTHIHTYMDICTYKSVYIHRYMYISFTNVCIDVYHHLSVINI